MDDTEPAVIGATCLVLHVRRAARRLGRLYDDALRPVGLTNGQFSLMSMLAAKQDWAMQPLADALALDQSSLTAAMKPLLRRGLVALEQGVADRRVRRLGLTAEGSALHSDARTLWRAAQRDAEALLGHRSSDALRHDLRRLA